MLEYISTCIHIYLCCFFVLSLLNKLTPDNFDKLSLELIHHVDVNSPSVLKGTIILVMSLCDLLYRHGLCTCARVCGNVCSVYICVCVCMHICTYVHMCTCIPTYMYILYVHTECMYVFVVLYRYLTRLWMSQATVLCTLSYVVDYTHIIPTLILIRIDKTQ